MTTTELNKHIAKLSDAKATLKEKTAALDAIELDYTVEPFKRGSVCIKIAGTPAWYFKKKTGEAFIPDGAEDLSGLIDFTIKLALFTVDLEEEE